VDEHPQFTAFTTFVAACYKGVAPPSEPHAALSIDIRRLTP